MPPNIDPLLRRREERDCTESEHGRAECHAAFCKETRTAACSAHPSHMTFPASAGPLSALYPFLQMSPQEFATMSCISSNYSTSISHAGARVDARQARCVEPPPKVH